MPRMFLIALLLGLALPLRSANTVQVDAATPAGSLPDELFGQNWVTYDKSGDGSDPAYAAALRAMGAKTLRVPGGGYASLRAWDDITCGGKDASWLVDQRGMLAFARAAGVQLQPVVNFGGFWCDQAHGYDAAIAKAAAWVRYLNVSPKASPARYWEVGNEVFYDKDKSHTDGATYAAQFARFSKAMKAVDPSIQLGFCLFEDRSKDKLPWNLAALQALKATGVLPDFWVVHFYPIWLPDEARTAAGAPSWNKNWYADSPSMDTAIQNNVALVEKDTRDLDQTITDVFGAGMVGKIPYWMTEFRSVLALKYIEYIDAMSTAQVLLEMGRLGWKGANIWDLKNGFDAKTQADFGLLRGGRTSDPDDNPKDSPRPAYYVYPFLSRVFGRSLVQAGADGDVKAWAGKDSYGDLTLFLVNTDLNEQPAQVRISLNGFSPAPVAERWTLQPAGTDVHGNSAPLAHLRDITVNGVLRPDPSALPGRAKGQRVSSNFTMTLPPLAMCVLRIHPQR